MGSSAEAFGHDCLDEIVAMFENEAVACRDVKQQVGGGGAAEYAGGNNVPEPISLIFDSAIFAVAIAV